MEVLQRTANRGSISTGYDIDNSCKFEPDNSESMSRTPAGNGNLKTCTLSFWVKITELNKSHMFFTGDYGGAADPWFVIGLISDKIYISSTAGISGDSVVPSRLLRDTSAWYHLVFAFDTTQGTAADRIKIYVNGVQETVFTSTTYPSLNEDLDIMAAKAQGIAGYNDGTDYRFAGYMSEFVGIDGQALAPTEFGEFDADSGIWKPIDVSGLTFGTNGFYLDFKDSANLGNDASGGLDFTLNNITSADQATDTPTNNFCTLNFNTGYIQGSDATTFTQGATTRQGGSSSYNGALGTIGINPFVGSAKWYWEVELSADCDGDGIELGAGWLATSIIQSTTEDKATAGNSAGFQIWTSFNFDPPNEGTGADGDVFGFLLQCDSSNPNLKIYKNDTLFTTRHTATSYDFENDFYFPVVFIYNTGMKAFCNFGNPFDATVSSGNTDPNGYGNFEFDTKSGYALCTKNLAEFG
jgi:hypothetical protein